MQQGGEELRSRASRRAAMLFMGFAGVVLIALSSLSTTGAVTYQPGVKPGISMKYQFSHYPDIKEDTVAVVAVEDNLITLKTTSAYYDGSTKEETFTINIGSSGKTTIVPTDQAWSSIYGENAVNVVGDHLEMTLTPKSGYAEVAYTFQEPSDLSGLSYFYYYISLSGVEEGERYTIWMTDTNGKSKYFPIQFDPDDPRRSQYLVWDRREWYNFDTIPSEELDRAQIKRVSLIYEGNSTRRVMLKGFETDQPLAHGRGYFKYFLVSSGLVKGDPLYPDVTEVINEERPNDEYPEPIILQYSYRMQVTAFSDCEGGFCGSAYTYDTDTGILVKYWTAKSGVQIQLAEQQGAWSPPDTVAFVTAYIHQGWLSYGQPNFWYIVGAFSIYAVGFTGIVIYDRWRRGTLTLGMMRQWWPFLVILLLIFVLGEVIRRLGM